MIVMAREQLDRDDPALAPRKQQPITEYMQRAPAALKLKPRSFRDDDDKTPTLVQRTITGQVLVKGRHSRAPDPGPSKDAMTAAWRSSALQQRIHDGQDMPEGKRKAHQREDHGARIASWALV